MGVNIWKHMQVSSPTSVVADASKLGQRTIDSGVSPSTGPYSHAKGLQRSNGESTSTTNGPAGKGVCIIRTWNGGSWYTGCLWY